MTDPRPEVAILDEKESWQLLGEGHVGRVALEGDDGLVVMPVNYAVDGTDVVFRTQEGHLLGRAADWGRRVAFQVDHLDEELEQGWSVLAQGDLRRAAEADAQRLGNLVTPWAAGDRPVVGRIIVSRIYGRRVGG